MFGSIIIIVLFERIYLAISYRNGVNTIKISKMIWQKSCILLKSPSWSA